MAKRTTKTVNANIKPRLGLRKADIIFFTAALVLINIGILRHLAKNSPTLCEGQGSEYVLEIKDYAFVKPEIALNRCDVIKVVNRDTQAHSLAFGVHEKHIAYPGYTQTLIRPNEFIMIDMVQAGQYRLHDHLRDRANTEIIVKETR